MLKADDIRRRIRFTSPLSAFAEKQKPTVSHDVTVSVLVDLVNWTTIFNTLIENKIKRSHKKAIINLRKTLVAPQAVQIQKAKERISNQIRRYRSVTEAHVYNDTHIINALILIEKFDGTEVKIYDYILDVESKYDLCKFDIAVLRKENICDTEILENIRKMINAVHYYKNETKIHHK